MKRIISLILALTLTVGIVAQMAPAVSAETVTDSSGVNMREGPGTNYNLIIGVPAGTVLTVQQTQVVDGYTWGKVTYSGYTGWIRLDFTDYQAPSTQKPATGWHQENNKWYYYENSVMVTGWKLINNSWYYMDPNGVMVTGWRQINNVWYYMDSSGAMVTGWLTLGITKYYLNESGAMVTGWKQLDNNWYYFLPSGAMALSKTVIDGVPHSFNTDGVWQGQSTYALSASGLDFIKNEEGFSAFPYWDYSQWSIGYGSRCPDAQLEYYKTNGISMSDAETLLRMHLSEMEGAIDAFILANSLTLTQNQYDALVSFTYNCGSSWCSEVNGTFHNAIKNQVTGNDMVRAFALWCSAGGEIILMRRRLCEANMYINGVYSNTQPENYCHVLYDANGGTTSPRTQGYDSNLPAAPYPVPVYEGYTFAGWYTAKTGGTKVTALDKSHNGTTLYAQWTANSGQQPPAQTPSEVVVTVLTDDVNLRQGAGTNYPNLTTKPQADKNDKLTIVETATGGTLRWGRFTEHGGGWICLDYTDYDAAVAQQQKAGTWVQQDGKWYYAVNGVNQTGWQQVDGKWYYLGTDGVMTTGWQFIGGKWYYMNSYGAMLTGWVRSGSTWYYMRSNGAMATGWVKDGNTWYYMANSGAMATGWVQDGATWYYMCSSGAMATGWVMSGPTWYYMRSNGAMATGWVKDGNTWYYMANSGAMVTGSTVIDGKTHRFSASGAWLG